MIERLRPETPEELHTPKASAADLARLLDLEIELEAVLGEKRVPLGDLSGTSVGSDLLLLPRGEPVRLVAGNVEIGEGTAVEIEGRLALRIDRLRPIRELAAELGGFLREDGHVDPPDSP